MRFVIGMYASDALAVWHRPIVAGARRRGAIGVTLGRTVYLNGDRTRTNWPLLVHECVHVAQYVQTGVPLFLLRYGTEYVGNRFKGKSDHVAYMDLKSEVEARQVEDAARRAERPRGAFLVELTND